MNIGIIGTGSIACKLAEAINRVDGAKLFAISSRKLEKSRSFAEKFNVTNWYQGTEDFYRNEEIDLVYIATPNSCHYTNTIEALNNGKAVLCEKPFAMDLEEASLMVDLAKNEKLLLVEAMWTKYFPGIKKVKEILESGALGEIVTIHGDLSYPMSDGKSRLFSKSMGGGALMDLGIYPISLTHLLLGSPDSIKSSAVFTDTGVDESTSMIFSYPNGITALLSCSIKATTTNEYIVCCTNGWIRINGPFHYPTSISCSINGQEQHQEFPRESLGYEYQIEGLLKDFNNGLKESSTVKLNDTLEIMKILDWVRKDIGLTFNE